MQGLAYFDNLCQSDWICLLEVGINFHCGWFHKVTQHKWHTLKGPRRRGGSCFKVIWIITLIIILTIVIVSIFWRLSWRMWKKYKNFNLRYLTERGIQQSPYLIIHKISLCCFDYANSPFILLLYSCLFLSCTVFRWLCKFNFHVPVIQVNVLLWSDIWNVSYIELRRNLREVTGSNPVEVLTFSGFCT